MSERLNDSGVQQAREEYLAPTPEAFLRWLKLLKCDRMYMAPVYEEYWSHLLNPTSRDVYLLPRGSYKTTCLQALAMRDIVINPNIRILYCCDTYAQAKLSLGWIKRQFERNEEFRAIFGDFVGERGWRDEYLWVKGRTDLSKKEPTLMAAGADKNITGGHYDKIDLDDMVTELNSRTKSALQSTIDWLKALFYIAEDVVDPETGEVLHRTEIIDNGTRYDDGDMHGWIIRSNEKLERENSKGKWRVYVKPAELDNGRLLFPHLTRDVLDEKRATGVALYNAQMLQDPVPSEFALFKREHFKIIPKYEIPPIHTLYCYLLADTATTEDREDYTCLTVLAKDALHNIYVLDMLVGQWAPSQVVENMLSLYRKWPCRKLTLEKISANEVYTAMIDGEAMRRQVKIRIEPIFGRTTESKQLRIQSLEGVFNAGKVYFSGALPKHLIRSEGAKCYGEIVDQFLRFPKGAHDDIPDCMSDINKTDRNNSPICPAPSLRVAQRLREKSTPHMINGRLATVPQTPGKTKGNFWGNLRTKMGG